MTSSISTTHQSKSHLDLLLYWPVERSAHSGGKTDNIAKDPLLISLRGGLTLQRFEKLNFRKPSFVVYC